MHQLTDETHPILATRLHCLDVICNDSLLKNINLSKVFESVKFYQVCLYAMRCRKDDLARVG